MDSFLHYEFLQRGLLMALLGGSVCGVIGVFVVLWRMSLVGMCISHAAFAGSLLALMFDFPVLIGSTIASLGTASFMGPLSERPGFSLDTALGVIFSVAMSVAMIILGLLPGARIDGLNLIWGSLLTVTKLDIWLMGAVATAIFSFVILFFKEIQAIIGQRRSALASGIPVKKIYYGCLILMGLVVAFSLKAIGGFLIFSLIVTPAAAAFQLTYSLRNMFVFSALIGSIASASGLWLSFYFSIPPGAAIVLIAAIILIISMLFSPKKLEKTG